MIDESGYSHVLYQDDLSHLPLGFIAHNGPGVNKRSSFKVIARGLGKYIEYIPNSTARAPGIHSFGNEAWADYCLRAVVTPVSFEAFNCAGAFCGIVARYKDALDYIALVLDCDERLKLLRRTFSGFELLASAPLEFCMGQSLSLTLAVRGGDVIGTAGPYTGATTIRAGLECGSGVFGGKAGFIAASSCRFGPHTVECAPEEATRIAETLSASQNALSTKRTNFPQMKLDQKVPLRGLAAFRNVEFADIDGDGKLEILAGQSSSRIAQNISLTKLTCLTALNFDGKVLWQAGVPDDSASGSAWPGELPFRFHDLFGDGHPVVVCVFGYDIQVRDAKTGKVLMSAQTPPTVPVSDEFKAVVGGGTPWGDETLNMNVSRIAFCDTQGSGAKKEIVVADDFNLVVLDPLAEPTLDPMFRHRGDLRGSIWIGDIDGDGKDELFAGSSLLDNDGSLLNTVHCAARAASKGVCDPAREGANKRVCVCGGDEGIWILDASELLQKPGDSAERGAQRVRGGYFSDLVAAHIQADSSKIQFAASGRGQVSFFDANFHKIGSHRFESSRLDGIRAVNWTGKPERLLLLSMEENGGLIDGHGHQVVPLPEGRAYSHCKIIQRYCQDGRDAIAAWNSDELSIYVPAS